MTFRKWNNERQDFDPEQIKIINNMMVFTDSGFDDTKMAIGKISLSNGTTAYGINAEVFVGTAIFSQYFTAQNPSGTFKIDDSGLSATNGINTIKIQPNNSGELFSIYKGNNKQLYFTSDGDAEFSGNLKSATGTFSGLISGGEINLGNGTFTVDKDGNMHGSSCNISGDINGANITGGTIDGAKITGSTIYIEDGGKVGDFTISDGELSYGNFGFFGDKEQFISISPKGKEGMIYVDSTNYFYSNRWAFASTGFGVTYSGGVYSKSMTVWECEDSIPNSVPNINWVKLWTTNTLIGQITPTSAATTKDKAPSYAACAEMINNIKSLIPSTSQFATKSDLNNYSREGHTHSQYVTTSYLASELQQTRQWVLANFERK